MQRVVAATVSNLAPLAEALDNAVRHRKAIEQLTKRSPDLTVKQAYAVQALSVARRLTRGERRIGVKMGLTSRAKMEQMGVKEVIWGRLTDAMLLEEGGKLSCASFIHPRAEPEVAFLIGKPLAGDVSALTAMAAVEAVAPALEIIDSRYADFKFQLADVIADNSSSAGLVIGKWNDPSVDISNLGMIFEIDGQAVEIGSSAAILGHPVRSLVAAARMVAQAGEQLNPGDIVMAGAATAAHALAVGSHVRAIIQHLGTVSITTEK